MVPNKDSDTASSGFHIETENPPTDEETGVSSLTTKRKRSTSSVPELPLAPASPIAPIRQTRSVKNPKTRNKAIDKGLKSGVQFSESQSLDVNADGKEKGEPPVTTTAAKVAKEGPRKWRKDWKDWISAPENMSTDRFERTYDEDLINVKESAKVYGIKGEELATLPHCPVQNPHGKGFTPMKFFRKADVIRLAYRKEAILAGEPQDDEEELLTQGQMLFEEKHG